MKEPALEEDMPQCAASEETRVRQSEYINPSVISLQQKLLSLDLQLSNKDILSLPNLPPVLIDALQRYVSKFECEVSAIMGTIQKLKSQTTQDEARAQTMFLKLDRLRADVAFLSDKSSADLLMFREKMRFSSEAAKERNRDLAHIRRKREKVEMETRRTEMELDRLGKISKRVRI